MHHMARRYIGRNNIELIRNGISRRVDMRYFVWSHGLFFMNRKLAAAASTAVILLLMPTTATAVFILTRLPACLSCLPAYLLVCLICRSPFENSFYRARRGEMGPGDVCRVPPASVRNIRAIQIQGQDSAGIVEGSCGYRVREVSIRRNSFYRETWGTRLGGSSRS